MSTGEIMTVTTCGRPHTYTIVILGQSDRCPEVAAAAINVLAEVAEADGEGYAIARHRDGTSCRSQAEWVESEAIRLDAKARARNRFAELSEMAEDENWLGI